MLTLELKKTQFSKHSKRHLKNRQLTDECFPVTVSRGFLRRPALLGDERQILSVLILMTEVNLRPDSDAPPPNRHCHQMDFHLIPK